MKILVVAINPAVRRAAWGACAYFVPGFAPVSAARAAPAFQRSIEGVQTGQVYKVW